jgi:hypothetical protein
VINSKGVDYQMHHHVSLTIFDHIFMILFHNHQIHIHSLKLFIQNIFKIKFGEFNIIYINRSYNNIRKIIIKRKDVLTLCGFFSKLNQFQEFHFFSK